MLERGARERASAPRGSPSSERRLARDEALLPERRGAVAALRERRGGGRASSARGSRPRSPPTARPASTPPRSCASAPSRRRRCTSG